MFKLLAIPYTYIQRASDSEKELIETLNQKSIVLSTPEDRMSFVTAVAATYQTEQASPAEVSIITDKDGQLVSISIGDPQTPLSHLNVFGRANTAIHNFSFDTHATLTTTKIDPHTTGAALWIGIKQVEGPQSDENTVRHFEAQEIKVLHPHISPKPLQSFLDAAQAGPGNYTLSTEDPFTQPEWVKQEASQWVGSALNTPKERSLLAIDLAHKNVIHKTGGPFGTVITKNDGTVLALAVNRVIPDRDTQNNTPSSTSHGEVSGLRVLSELLKIMSPQERTELEQDGIILNTSAETCIMCAESIEQVRNWNIPIQIEYSATSAQVEKIAGFNEGNKDHLVSRKPVHITHQNPPKIEEKPLAAFRDSNPLIYNARNATT